MTQQTRFTQTNCVPRRCTCHAHIRTVHWAPRGSPSQKYLPASRVFLFHNTRLLSPDRVRCFLFPIPPASLENICPPRGFFYFIAHGCYLRTVCDVSCSQSCLHRKYLPASRVFIFHNTRLLSLDRVRCTIIKIFNSPAFHSRV